MRILIVTQIYLPEMGAMANRLYPFTRALSAAGHEVAVATGMPNYPEGKVFPDFRGKFLMTEKAPDCEIFRTHYYCVPRNRSKISQLFSYLTFMPAAFLSGLRARRFDLVFITSPPLFPILPAIALAKSRGAKLVYDIRDLWSDELVTYGGMSDASPFVRLSRKIENFGYRQADLITVTTESLAETIRVRGNVAPEKIMYLPNGADLELFQPLPAKNEITDRFPFGNRFVVMYSGLFGIKHSLESLIGAAEILRENRDICFFLVGNGARREALEKLIAEKKLHNVILASEHSVKEIPHLIARADVCFAASRAEPYPRQLISVKIFEYLACEKPVIGAIEGESANVIKKAGGGIVVQPGNEREIADAILNLYANRKKREKMGKQGRRYITENFSRSQWADLLEQKLTGLFENQEIVQTSENTSSSEHIFHKPV